MQFYRRIEVGETAPDAVTVGIEKDAEGALRAAVWWPAHGDIDADEAEYPSVPEALAAAHAAQELHGFAEVLVTLQSDDLWDAQWGELRLPNHLDDAESFELARATEAMRDA
jgi:hypothetical protein